MRIIKFRARPHISELANQYHVRNSKFIRGFYYQHDGKHYIIDKDETWQINPDTLQQFVGFDKNGRDVYEGDVIDNPFLSPLGFPVGSPLSVQLTVDLVDIHGNHFYPTLPNFRWLP